MYVLNRKYLLVALPLVGFLWFACSVVIAGYFYPDYSHTAQFISELGATGSPHGDYVNYLGFIPTELFIFSFIVISYSVLPATRLNIIGLVFIAIYAMTLGVAAFFPCDFECKPEVATTSHNIHMASAFPGYLCGIIAIFLISAGAKLWSKSNTLKVCGYLAGGVALLAFVNLDPDSKYLGLSQRILELLIYSWLVLLGYSLSQYLSGEESSKN